MKQQKWNILKIPVEHFSKDCEYRLKGLSTGTVNAQYYDSLKIVFVRHVIPDTKMLNNIKSYSNGNLRSTGYEHQDPIMDVFVVRVGDDQIVRFTYDWFVVTGFEDFTLEEKCFKH